MSPVPRDVIDADVRKVIAMARELAALKAHELAAHTGSDAADVLGAYAAAFGEAKVLLRSLAAIAERLSGNRYSFTRDQLIGALTRLEACPATAGPGQRTFIVAESMADAIIEALEDKPEPVHYRWPIVCGGQVPGTKWTGNLDRVTCAACCAITEERLASGQNA